MPIKIGIGFSNETNSELAARNAAFEAKTNLEADRIDLGICFFSTHYDPAIITPVVRRILNNAPLVGSSTAGIILPNSIETRGIGILTMHSDELVLGLGGVDRVNTRDTIEAGKVLAQNAISSFGKHSRHAFMFFVDGQLTNKSPLIKGVQEVLGHSFPLVGGGCSDDFHFKNSFQIYQDSVLEHGAAGVIFGGDITIGIGNRHGWRPLGKPRIIDEVSGNVIKIIDGKKASNIYEEYFGEKTNLLRDSQLGKMSILYPLGIKIEGSNEYLIRNTIDILSDGSIVSQGDVPEEAEVHIMIGNKDSCKIAALEAAEEALKNFGSTKQASVLFIIDSMARLKLQGRSAFEEIRKAKEIFNPKIPAFGMYSNGEICPFQKIEDFKKPHLQNESIVIFAVG